MRSLLLVAVSGALAIAIAQGCGGAAATTGTAGNGGSGASGSSSSGKSSSKATTGTGGSTASSSGAASSASTTASSSGSTACPDETGTYTVALSGAGCGDLASSAPQCIIVPGIAACEVEFVSQGPAGSALNGAVDLDTSGDFANGAITEGTANRSGCTGTWNAAMSQLTVDCGGMGTSQSCVATLTRTGNGCAFGSSSASSSSGGAACPDELGAYTVTVMGAGCGDLVPGAPQCISAGTSACEVQLVSQGGSAGSALNGTVDLDMSGGFASGAVTEGTANRSGCTGTWDAATSQLTVDCGGMGTSQSCVATLTRTGNTCQ